MNVKAQKRAAEAQIAVAERVYSVNEIADLLFQKPSTIKTWIRTKQLQGTPIGKSWVILDSDLQGFLERQRSTADAEIARRSDKAIRSGLTTRAKKKKAEKG